MTQRTRDHVRVDCTECSFSRIVGPDDGVIPAEVVIEHGRETGHHLSTVPIDGDDE